MNFLAFILAMLFFLAGLAGIILPILPGTALIFAGMLIYGFMTDFEHLDIYFFIIQGIAVVLTFATDYIAAAIGTKRYGGSKKASLGAIIGTILGAILLPPLGIFIGAFCGAIAGELIGEKSPEQALKTGLSALVGFLGSAVVKFSISIAMIVWFFIRVL